MTLLYLSYFFGSSINKKRVSGKVFFFRKPRLSNPLSFFHWAFCIHSTDAYTLSRKWWSKYQGSWKTPFNQLPSVSWSHQALLYGIKKGLCLTEGVYILYLYRDSACVGFLWSIYFSRNELVKWSYIFSLCVPLQLWRELETVCSDIKLEIGKKDPFKHAEMCLLIEAWYVPYYEGILQTLLLQIAPFPFAPGMGYTSY